MILYSAIGPNPKTVRMFAAEKDISIELREVDLIGGENRRFPFLGFNPAGQVPVLETDEGNFIAEATAICEYLEEVSPAAPLIGTNPSERAEARMWARRLDLNILQPMANGFRFSEGLKFFEGRHSLHAAGRRRPEAIGAGVAILARWSNGRQDLHLWFAPYPRRPDVVRQPQVLPQRPAD